MATEKVRNTVSVASKNYYMVFTTASTSKSEHHPRELAFHILFV
jgi:hypothetical protein